MSKGLAFGLWTALVWFVSGFVFYTQSPCRIEAGSHHYQVYVNESRILDTNSTGDEWKTLSVLERVFYLTKASAIVQIDVDGKQSKREYCEGKLCHVPGGILGINVQDGVKTQDKVN